MERRTFLKTAALGSLVVSAEMAGAFDLGDAMNAASQVAAIAQVYRMGEKEEVAIGEAHYRINITKSGGLYPDENAQKALQAFAKPLIATSERKNLPWEIVLLNDKSINAWAMPGGKLAVNAGLLKAVKTPEELASVISHEIGHVERAHAIATIQNQAFVQSLGAVAKQALAAYGGGAGGLGGELLGALEAPLYQLVLSGYSRGHELEADAHILRVSQKVGLNPTKADDFFLTLDSLYPSDSTITTSLFSTHPVTRERIATLEKQAKSLTYKHTPSTLPGWKELKSRVKV